MYILRLDLMAECLVKQMLATDEGAIAAIPKGKANVQPRNPDM